jgi:hypothetical protein
MSGSPMAIPPDKLDSLKSYKLELSYAKPQRTDEIKEKASKIIAELYTEVQNKDLSLEECNKIYEVIEPFSKVDLSEKVFGVAWLAQSVYSSIWGTPKDNLITYLNEKRVVLMTELINEETFRVNKQHQQWIQSIHDSPSEIFDPNSIREQILAMRAESPRAILSIQDEIDLMKDSLHEQLVEPSSSQGEKNLQGMLNVLRGPLFTMDYYIDAASQKEKHPTGAIVLNPDPAMLSKEGVDRLRVQRLYRLENLETVYQQSLNRPHSQVAGKWCEPTSAVYVGGFRSEKPCAPFELEMQQIGQENGIKVISDIRIGDATSLEITDKEKTDLMLDCEPILINNGLDSLGAFPQDFVDFSRNGEIRIPTMRQSRSNSAIDFDLEADRVKRSPEWKDVFDRLGEKAILNTLGAPYNNNLSLKAIALASSLKTIPIMNLTYSEGGNVLIGKKGDEPYALIGKDSNVASKFLMEKDLGREVTHDEIMMAFAIDYGILKEDIHFIEQPGDFHLDMSMVIVGDTILLNDSEEAQKMFSAEQQEWYTQTCNQYPAYKSQFTRFLNEEVLQSQVREKLEDVTERELRELGFNVVRVPGRFNYNIKTPVMNFFNMVTAETPSGKNIAVMLGCKGEYAESFEQTLRKYSDREIDNVYFLDEKSTQECLRSEGGISCRTKTIPFVQQIGEK